MDKRVFSLLICLVALIFSACELDVGKTGRAIGGTESYCTFNGARTDKCGSSEGCLLIEAGEPVSLPEGFYMCYMGAIYPDCVDSDGDLSLEDSYYEKGYITHYRAITPEVVHDECVGNSIREVGCSGGGGYSIYGLQTCPNGCSDGACLGAACTDTDGGRDPLVKGTCTASWGTNADRCQDSTILVEASCDVDCDGVSFDCATLGVGYVCDNDACVEGTACTDPDGFGNYNVKATCTDQDGDHPDSCSSPTEAIDYQCVGQSCVPSTIACGIVGFGFVCQDGVCAPETCSDNCTSLGYQCGVQTVCGASFDCGGCDPGYICSSGTCIQPGTCTDNCTSLGYQCGVQTVCGASFDCGGCDPGYTCSSGTCIQLGTCTDNCTSLEYECGVKTICGESVDCGGCNTGYTCSSGRCVSSGSCLDSDGEDYRVKGNCTDRIRTYPDSCALGRAIDYQCFDQLCDGTSIECTTYGPNYVCRDGACVKGDCTDNCTTLEYECGIQAICGEPVNCGSCDTGYICSSGKCSSQVQVDCTDPDGARNYLESRTCTDKNGDHPDSCLSSTEAVDFHCLDKLCKKTSTDCTLLGSNYVCRGGACVEEECTDTCDSLGHQCGTHTICGEKVDCPSCGIGKDCSDGKCVSGSTPEEEGCLTVQFNNGSDWVKNPIRPVIGDKTAKKHYSYGKPTRYSYGGPYAELDSTVYYLYQDPDGNLNLVVVNDKVGKNNGGTLHLQTDFDAKDHKILTDDYSLPFWKYDKFRREGVNWKWKSPYTDGGVFTAHELNPGNIDCMEMEITFAPLGNNIYVVDAAEKKLLTEDTYASVKFCREECEPSVCLTVGVDEGSGWVDTPLETVKGDKDPASFYDYVGRGRGISRNQYAESDKTTYFIYESPENEYSLFVINDVKDDRLGGFLEWRTNFDVKNSFIVMDDNEFNKNPPNDKVYEQPPYGVDWLWGAPATDGGVFKADILEEGNEGCMEMRFEETLEFPRPSITHPGIDSIQVVDGGNPRELTKKIHSPVRFCRKTCSGTPPPGCSSNDDCEEGMVCEEGVCVQEECTDTCDSLDYECGTHTICGEEVDCPSCSEGYSCVSGRCVSSGGGSCLTVGVDKGNGWVDVPVETVKRDKDPKSFYDYTGKGVGICKNEYATSNKAIYFIYEYPEGEYSLFVINDAKESYPKDLGGYLEWRTNFDVWNNIIEMDDHEFNRNPPNDKVYKTPPYGVDWLWAYMVTDGGVFKADILEEGNGGCMEMRFEETLEFPRPSITHPGIDSIQYVDGDEIKELTTNIHDPVRFCRKGCVQEMCLTVGVNEGDGWVDTPLEVIEGDKDPKRFYDYVGKGRGISRNQYATSDTTTYFIYEYPENEYSLFIINDIKDDRRGGYLEWRTNFDVNNYLEMDDHEFNKNPPNDKLYRVPPYGVDWLWGAPATDGGVFNADILEEGSEGCMEMYFDENAIVPARIGEAGIDSIQVIDGGNPRELTKKIYSPIRFCRKACSGVSPPPPRKCQSDSDCSSGKVCKDGDCVSPPGGACLTVEVDEGSGWGEKIPIETVKGTDSAGNHYKYRQASYNNDHSLADSTVYYIYEQSEGKYSLVVVHDKHGDEGGGEVDWRPSFDVLNNMILLDDDFSRSNDKRDSSEVNWKWDRHTDGGVFKAEELEQGECIEMEITKFRGLKGISVYDGQKHVTLTEKVDSSVKFCMGECSGGESECLVAGVDEGSGWDDELIAPVFGDKAPKRHYNYDRKANPASYGGPYSKNDATVYYIYEYPKDEYYLIVVHDAVVDDGGGKMKWNPSFNAVDRKIFIDDPHKTDVKKRDSIKWTWNSKYTDGGIFRVGEIEPGSMDCIEMEISEDEGINTIYAFDGDIHRNLTNDVNSPVRFCRKMCPASMLRCHSDSDCDDEICEYGVCRPKLKFMSVMKGKVFGFFQNIFD